MADVTVSADVDTMMGSANNAAIRSNIGVGTQQLSATFDGGGLVLVAASKVRVRVPFACTITAATIVADQSGSAVVDIWKDTYANYPPTVADTITASAKPTLSSAIKNTDSTLTGWTVALAAGDWLFFNLDSITTCTYVRVDLSVTRA